MYQILRDFAGPFATILASVTAAYFVRRQALTAERQAETAIDQLRYNLFKKRYDFYEDIKNLLIFLVNESNYENFEAIKVVPYYARKQEAIFFFSPAICEWMAALQSDCQDFLMAHRRNDHIAIASAKRVLMQHATGMPARFETELAFRQLRRNGAATAHSTRIARVWRRWRRV